MHTHRLYVFIQLNNLMTNDENDENDEKKQTEDNVTPDHDVKR